MAIERRHRGIEAVALDQLQLQAFGEVAGEHARRLQRLQGREHALDARERRAELFGDLGELAAEIAGLVEAVDQRRGDQPVAGIGQGDHRLAGEEFGEALLRSDIGLDVGGVLVAAAAARRPDHWPPESAGPSACAARPGAAVRSGSNALSISVPSSRASSPGSTGKVSPAQSPGVASDGDGFRRRLGLAALLGAVEQGVALQLGLDERRELAARHLQAA